MESADCRRRAPHCKLQFGRGLAARCTPSSASAEATGDAFSRRDHHNVGAVACAHRRKYAVAFRAGSNVRTGRHGDRSRVRHWGELVQEMARSSVALTAANPVG